STNYGQVSFAVSVNGAGTVRNVTMYPPITNVFGLVVDAASGIPLGGAGGTIVGRATDQKAINETIQRSAPGAFQAQLPQGTYTITGVYGGYTNGSQSVTPNGAASHLVVGLQSVA